MTNCLTNHCENGADNKKLLPLPKDKFGNYLEVGDVIEFKMKQNQLLNNKPMSASSWLTPILNRKLLLL